MADQIKHDELIEKGVFNPTIKDAKKLLKELKLLEKAIMDLLKQSKEFLEQSKQPTNTKEIKALQKTLVDVAKTEETLNKVRTEKLKLEDKLKEARSDSIQDNEEIKVQLTEQKKVNKQLAKEKLGLITAYDKEAKRLNDLRKEYKKLRVEEGKETKQTIKLKKEIQKLDRELKEIDADVGQFQRSVGDYGEAAKEATGNTLKWIAALVGLDAGISGVNSTINANEEGSEKLRTAQAKLGAVSNTLKNRFVASGSAIADFFGDLINGDKNITQLLFTLNGAVTAFDGTTQEIRENVAAAEEAEKSTIALEKSSRGLRLEIEKLNGEIEEQNLIAGDTTRSFNEIEEATQKATKLQIQRAFLLRDIAQKELDIINSRIEATSEDSNLLELKNEQTEKQIELQTIQNELDAVTIDNQKILREVQRDRFERELDFAIDAFDAVKTVSERQIALEDATIAHRVGNLNKLKTLADSSFKEQIKLVEGFTQQSLELNELVLLDDEKVIRERLRRFTLDDVTLGRILEIIRERKLLTQDIADAERDVTAAIQEQLDASDQLLNDIDQVRRQGRIDAADDEKEARDLREEALIAQAKFELNLVADTSDEAVLIREKLKNDLAAIDRERVEDVKKSNREQLEDERRIQDARLAAASNTADLIETLAQGDEEQQKRVQRLKKTLAITDIFINLNREISDIRARNAEKDNGKQLNRAEILEATTSALAGAAGVLSAYEGTEDTGGRGNVDSKGGKTWTLHPHERVMTAKQNSMVGDMSNDSLAQLAFDYKSGRLFMEPHLFTNLPKSKNGNISAIVGQMRKDNEGLRGALKRYQSTNTTHWNSLNETIDTRIEEGIKKTVINKRTRI